MKLTKIEELGKMPISLNQKVRLKKGYDKNGSPHFFYSIRGRRVLVESAEITLFNQK